VEFPTVINSAPLYGEGNYAMLKKVTTNTLIHLVPVNPTLAVQVSDSRQDPNESQEIHFETRDSNFSETNIPSH